MMDGPVKDMLAGNKQGMRAAPLPLKWLPGSSALQVALVGPPRAAPVGLQMRALPPCHSLLAPSSAQEVWAG